MGFFYALNTGKGFIKHEDTNAQAIKGHVAGIWETENIEWANKVGAISKTLEEAQAIINEHFSDKFYPENHPNESLRGKNISYNIL